MLTSLKSVLDNPPNTVPPTKVPLFRQHIQNAIHAAQGKIPDCKDFDKVGLGAVGRLLARHAVMVHFNKAKELCTVG